MCAITTESIERYDDMSRASFIAWHVSRCQAGRCKKYDAKKSGAAVHSLAYSRRKCAKSIWRKIGRRLKRMP